MIRSIKIQNFQGIEYWETKFIAKNVVGEQGLDEQYISTKKKKEYIYLMPTFIARNASGKSSILNAIEFALSCASRNILEQNLNRLSHRVIMNKRQQKMERNLSNDNTKVSNDIKGNINDTALMHMYSWNIKFISEIFNMYHFKNESNSINIDLELTNNKKIIILIQKDNFIININGAILNIVKILSEIQNRVEHTYDIAKNRIAIKNYLDNNFEKAFLKEICYSYNSDIELSLFQGVPAFMNYRNILNIQLKNIQNIMGYDSLKLMLQYIDPNIISIQNIDNFLPEIFIRNGSGPILSRDLSSGTRKIIYLISKALSIFKTGGVLIVDEVENGLHPSLVKLIVRMFESSELNTKKAQLILSTHNPYFMESGLISTHNVFLYNESKHKMIHIKDENAFERTEDSLTMMKQKNYFDDMYWLRRNSAAKSTINNYNISSIIEKMIKK